jgi:hypothetical protein
MVGVVGVVVMDAYNWCFSGVGAMGGVHLNLI